MVESAAGLQLPGPQKEQGHLELSDAVQSPTQAACGGQQHTTHTLDQMHVRELAMGIGRQELEQEIPHNALPG